MLEVFKLFLLELASIVEKIAKEKALQASKVNKGEIEGEPTDEH